MGMDASLKSNCVLTKTKKEGIELMNVLEKIRPKEPLKTLKWVDILIVTIIMFGEFIIRSTQQFLQSLQPVTEVVNRIRRRQRPIATGQRIRVTLPYR